MTTATMQPPRSFELFATSSGVENGEALRAAALIRQPRELLRQDAFAAANQVTSRFLARGWRYDTKTYRLADMLKRKAGNCLGLTCLYGAVLQHHGFRPEYELVIGPKSYQRRDEQDVLDFLLGGHAFPFSAPLLPERPVRGEKLHFSTLEHPRLVLDGERFETTALQEQGPSPIEGEVVRAIDYQQLMSCVLFERAHQASLGEKPDFTMAEQLFDAALETDPGNREIHAEKSMLAFRFFRDTAFEKARDAYADAPGKDSKYCLQRFYLFNEVEDLNRALEGNPTDMAAWALKHIVGEKDTASQRANCAVAAHCVARSEVLNLGDFYAVHAPVLAAAFPKDAVSLLKAARDAHTNPFEYYFALLALGLCKGVEWSGKDKPTDYLQALETGCVSRSPLQETRLCFIAKSLPGYGSRWEKLSRQYHCRRTFRSAVRHLEEQWSSLLR